MLAFRKNHWPCRVRLSSDEYVMIHNTNVMVQFSPNNESENWSGEDIGTRPKVVRRGIAEIEDEIDDGKLEFVNNFRHGSMYCGKDILFAIENCESVVCSQFCNNCNK